MDAPTVGVRELREIYARRLADSARAVRKNPMAYKKLRGVLCRVVRHPVDVDDWPSLASLVADLCGEMGQGTIFYEYYHEHIHPNKKGRARFFRTECRELMRLCDELVRMRIEHSGLTLVQ